jgi:hypothetical protein
MKNQNTLLFVCLFLMIIRLHAANIACPEAGAFRITECGNATLGELLQEKSTCDPAYRMIKFVFWLDSFAKPCSTVITSVKERYAFYRDTIHFPIIYPDTPLAGSPDAPVRIMAYISMSCPLCKKVCHDLADSLQGPRAKQMAIYVKPFSSTPLEYALVAVQKLHKEAELFEKLATSLRERITIETLVRIADSLGIPRPELERLMADTATTAWIEASSAEATKNHVIATPSLFINGKPYPVYKTARWVIDAAEFEWKKTHKSGRTSKMNRSN